MGIYTWKREGDTGMNLNVVKLCYLVLVAVSSVDSAY